VIDRFKRLSFSKLRQLYGDDVASIESVFAELSAMLSKEEAQSVWIHRATSEEIAASVLRVLEQKRGGAELPLFGIPFAVKDNIDVAGMPTTAGCREFSYDPAKSSTLVDRALKLGAICLGKTNMDQFATGLTGTRSPFGICASAYDPLFIAGGSSSGSAVAVAKGMVPFAFGTDSGGSGRIPAGYNNIVGLKPTIGAMSLNGVVPNSRTFDCPSIFANYVDDALEVFDLVSSYDESDPFSKKQGCPLPVNRFGLAGFRIAAPRFDQCEWYGDEASASAFVAGLRRIEQLGGSTTEVDFSLFQEAGRLLLNGPWVAERIAGVRRFFERNADALLPVVRAMFERGHLWSAVDVFEASYRLQSLRHEVARIFDDVDAMIVPTSPRPYTIAEVLASPIEKNIEVGYYSYFVNLLDLCAVTLPNGFLPNGLPTSLTVVAPAWRDKQVCALARQLSTADVGEHAAAAWKH
jgi:allophanate hydrolase